MGAKSSSHVEAGGAASEPQSVSARSLSGSLTPLSAPTGQQPSQQSSSRRSSRETANRQGASGQQRKVSMWTQLQSGYGDLVNAIIRPPRANYATTDLGPSTFRISGRSFERLDVQVHNPQNMKLECSWWQSTDSERVAEELPCVIYMHGNSSCRLEALELVPLVLGMGVTLFAFDFSGCGISEGEYITLGYREKDDLREVISYLRASHKVSTIALWGRSMGAATALLHGHRDPSIAAVVLDSPFSSLERLAREIIDKAQIKHKPEFLVKAFMKMMRSTILKRSGLDILKLKPIENVSTCFIPALFVAGTGDQFIPPQHATDICDAYAGDKNLILVEGNHNSRRPAYLMDSVSIYFYSRLCVPVGLTEESLGLRPKVPADAITQIGGQSEHGSSAEAGCSASSGGDGFVAATDRLIGYATSQAQSTLPDSRTAAHALRA